MRLESIVNMYGMNDYYDIMSGRVFHLSEAHYDKQADETVVPVSECGKEIGVTRMKGNYLK